MFETAPAGLQNFFLFALTSGSDWKATPKPDATDPLAYLTGEVDPVAKREVFQLDRNMWCTAPFFHAAGRQIVERSPGQWEAVPASQPAQQVVKPFDFVPGRIAIDSRGRTTFQEGGQLSDPQAIATFKVLDVDHYQAVMTSCLKELFKKLPRADLEVHSPDQPVCLRAENLTLLPQSQPVVFAHVRNTSNTPYAGNAWELLLHSGGGRDQLDLTQITQWFVKLACGAKDGALCADCQLELSELGFCVGFPGTRLGDGPG